MSSELETYRTPGTKLQYLIKRRPDTSREELIAHWYANHMPGVIERNAVSKVNRDPFAHRYLVTLFDSTFTPPSEWDGVAQLWYDSPPPKQTQASGVVAKDSFHEKVEPYWSWPTHEWVAVDGQIPFSALTLNAPFPCTRSGFVKQTSLVAAKPDIDVELLFEHWLMVHMPNVQETFGKVDGIRYSVSLSVDPISAPYAGMAELYFPNHASQAKFWDILKSDGFQHFVDSSRTIRYVSGTEMIGIP